MVVETKRFALVLLVCLGLLPTISVQAQTQVQRLDEDTLVVELQYGKPPHQRLLIERAEDPEVFATFDALRLQTPGDRFAGFFGGAPGKNIPSSAPRSSDAAGQEIPEIDQDDEQAAAAPATGSQHWHGAPGKNHALGR